MTGKWRKEFRKNEKYWEGNFIGDDDQDYFSKLLLMLQYVFLT